MDSIDLINSVANATDSAIDPSVGLAIAQSSPDQSTAITNAQAAMSVQDGINLLNSYRQQDPGTQRKMWANEDPNKQQILTNLGYSQPKPHESGLFGALHSAISTVGKAIGTAAADTSSYIEKGTIHPIAQGLGMGLRAVQHTVRATHELSINNAANPEDAAKPALNFHANALGGPIPIPTSNEARDITDPGPLKAMFSPHEWAKAWKETTHGEQTFLPNVKADVKKQYGDDTYNIAQQLAGGKSVKDLLDQATKSGMAANDVQALATRITTDPDMVDAVRQLSSGKMSLGREIVGSDALYHNPKAANQISGAIDGIYDWIADPAMHVIEGLKDANAARYLVKSPEDVARVAIRPNVAAKFDQIADQIASGDAAAFRRANPALADQYNAMAKAGATSRQGVTDYFANKIAETNIIAGQPGGASATLQQSLPHLSISGQVRLTAKGTLSHAIDYLADAPARLHGIEPTDTIEGTLRVGDSRFTNWAHPLANTSTAIGRTLKALTTIVQTEFNPITGDAPGKLNDMLAAWMPQANIDNIVNAYANSPSLAQKAQIYEGVMSQIAHAAGWYETPEGATAADKWLANLHDSITKANFSFGDNAIMQEGVKSYTAPLTPGQADSMTSWPIPSYRDWFAGTKQVSIARSTFGIVNNAWVDNLMNKWKFGNVFRVGFAFRAAGDEALNYIANDGLASYLAGKVASYGVVDTNGTPGTIARLLGHIPLSKLEGVDDKASLIQTFMNDYLSRASKSLDTPAAADAIRIANANGGADSFINSQISAAHGDADGYVEHQPTLRELATHGKASPLTLSPSGAGVHQYNPTEEGAHLILAKNYDEIAKDPHFLKALETQGMGYTERSNEIADALQADPKWHTLERSTKSPSGKQLSTGDITERQLALLNADAIISHVDGLTLTTPSGGMAISTVNPTAVPVPGVRDYILDNGRSPSAAALAQLRAHELPNSFYGPELIPVNTKGYGGLLASGMDTLVGRPIDAISRKPMFWGHYIDEMADLKASTNPSAVLLRSGTLSPDAAAAAESTLHQLATQTAMDRTVPFIHNPEVRSQFAIVVRNLAPFYYAQEQFLKRWGKTFVYSPESLRQAQLTLNGIQHSGILHKDPQTGSWYFNYPATGALQSLITNVFGKFGLPASLPIAPNLRGQIQYLSPGTERLALPSFSPFVTVGLDAVAAHFPELADAKTNVLGPRSQGQSFLHQILPTSLARIADVIVSNNPAASPQYASAMMQAIAYLESSGHGLSENATLHDKQVYFDRVKNWTRALMVTRTLVGFSAPASPQQQINPDQWSKDFTKLLNDGLTYENAINIFMKAHPDARADTIFQSQSESGSPIPATDAALSFMTDHQSFLESYPYAGAWFIPQSTGTYSQAAYNYSLAEHLRTKKTPVQFYNDIKFAQDAPQYFDAEAVKNKLLADTGSNTALKAQISADWTQQSAAYLQSHPGFAQGLNGDPTDPLALGGKQLRTKAISEMESAIKDPRLPQSPQTDALKTLFSAYQSYQTQIDQFSGNRTASATRNRAKINDDFAKQAIAYVDNHPEVLGAFNKLIRPDISQYISKAKAAQL